MYNGQGGITHLNDILQDVMNPMSSKTKVIEAHNESFRIGDRILQLQNNPEKHNSNANTKQEQVQPEIKEEINEPKDYILTPDLIYSGKIDPMIGMEDIKLKTRD